MPICAADVVKMDYRDNSPESTARQMLTMRQIQKHHYYLSILDEKENQKQTSSETCNAQNER